MKKMIVWTFNPAGQYDVLVEQEGEDMTQTYADMVALYFGTDEERAAVRKKQELPVDRPRPANVPFSIHLLSYEVLDSSGKGAHLWK